MSELKKDYYSHLKSLNPDQESAYQSSSHYYKAEFSPLLPSDKGARILDAGCGFGHLVRFFVESGYLNSGGVEYDAEIFKHCVSYIGKQAAFLANNDAGTFVQNTKNEFDLIVSTDVIEHFTIEEALCLTIKYFHALKPGGKLILRTPNMANVFGVYSRYMDLTHQAGFTEQSLAQLLRAAGFPNPQLHLPDWKEHPNSCKFKWSTRLQRWIFQLQDRSMPLCFDKNIVMWAIKS